MPAARIKKYLHEQEMFPCFEDVSSAGGQETLALGCLAANDGLGYVPELVLCLADEMYFDALRWPFPGVWGTAFCFLGGMNYLISQLWLPIQPMSRSNSYYVMEIIMAHQITMVG